MFIIIPVKPFNQAKTRLATIMSPAERAMLSRRLLQRTLDLACRVGEVVVISRSQAVRRLAKQMSAWAIVEGHAGLNEALHQASQWAISRGAQAVMILPADLPLLSEMDLRELIVLSQPRPSVVIAPCRRQSGTNALVLRPPGLIELQFGPDSFEKHRRAAGQDRWPTCIYKSPTVAFDLDLPEDVAFLRQSTESSLFSH